MKETTLSEQFPGRDAVLRSSVGRKPREHAVQLGRGKCVLEIKTLPVGQAHEARMRTHPQKPDTRNGATGEGNAGRSRNGKSATTRQ